MNAIRIGDLTDRTGTSAPTIRYYEQVGLLRRATRPSGNHRVYSREDVERLTFIRRCREFDFSIEPCDTSCAGGPGPDCVILGDLGKH